MMGVQSNLASQIALLEQVQQQSAQSAATAAVRARRQGAAADRRLQAWGQWTVQAQRGDAAFIRSLAGELTGLGVGGSTNPNASGMPDSVYDTDRAVQQLTDRQRDVVELEYMRPDMLREQRAGRLGLAVPTYKRHLVTAKQKIFQLLYAPSGAACGRVRQRACEKSR
ncbi:MAG: hypothetical protein OIF57_11720 [Marinobacterium sp.]|nr:hypothetical protein [Marinobacterium sp.]